MSAVKLSETKNIDSRADLRKRIFFRWKEYVGRYKRGKECGGEVARNGEESGYRGGATASPPPVLLYLYLRIKRQDTIHVVFFSFRLISFAIPMM